MNILVVSNDVPRPDQSSGDLRFFTLLSMLAQAHQLSLWTEVQDATSDRRSSIDDLAGLGVSSERGAIVELLRREQYDLIFFEFYWVAEPLIDLVRAWQPRANIVVDSVDVHFHRLRSKARLSGLPTDHDEAEAVRRSELTVYGKADLVVTVSEEDSRILRSERLECEIAVIPNVHVMHSLGERQPSARLDLIFIGSYRHAPNVDAMVHFCATAMPLLRQQVPSLRLRIVGSEPTPEVHALACSDIEVVGFVGSTSPYLQSSDISVAPLRYGGGIKGKIGEALAHGVPVVTTTFGAEGFGFEPGKHVLVADTPEGFVSAILQLWRDKRLYDAARRAGWDFINDHYSVQAVGDLLPPLLMRLAAKRSKRIAPWRRVRIVARHYMEKYVLWRFAQ